ncbi:MAG TPA: nuclear transport factor 2 family protein [Longimicrobiales bacterium]|nr:nuclear transport factor 2 family protein [Longimicrobiales bacterium]
MTTATGVDIATLDRELNEMILEGRALEAFEKFYAEECVMKDQGFEPWVGKDVNREREKAFFAQLTEVRAFDLREVGVGDDVTFSIWENDYTHEEWGDMQYTQVAVRHWNDEGKIVKERFYRG